MKKLITLFALLCNSAFAFCQTQYDLGKVAWYKHEGPVFLPGEKGSWDAGGVFSPSVLKIDDTYHMWYSGMDGNNIRIGHATSEDGLVWVKDDNNPVVDLGEDGSFDDNLTYLPVVVYDGASFHMWYVGDPGSDGSESLGYATSEDGVSWTKQPGKPIFQLENGDPHEERVARGDVYYYEDKFHMWAGVNDAGSENADIGYFTSEDGVTWTAYENNPVLVHVLPGEWDFNRTQVSTVFEMDGEFHMWYCGGYFGKWQIGYASSPDGLDWTRAENNPVLRAEKAGEWDEVTTHFPTVMFNQENNELIMWYGGASTEGFGGIGYAETWPLSTSAIKSSENLKIYPIPAKELITIQTSIKGEKEIRIISIDGKTIYQGILTDEENQVDISSLPKGVYFVKMSGGERVLTGKVVVQ